MRTERSSRGFTCPKMTLEKSGKIPEFPTSQAQFATEGNVKYSTRDAGQLETDHVIVMS